MGPKVTLIGESWQSRIIVYGKKRYVFHGKEPLHVPVAVAVRLKGMKEKGKPVFRVEDMPTLVAAVHPIVENVTAFPRQRKLGECLSLQG